MTTLAEIHEQARRHDPMMTAALRFIADETSRIRAVLEQADGASGAVLSASVDAALVVIEYAARTALGETPA